MGLDYSQKRLVGSGFRSKKNKKLHKYAFLTGVMGMLISLVQLILTALR
ncbi:hypothetical protein KKD95_03345 [Patescibacteria group bacterium]|nr:hypothetical protein [Patescibacteria group bacterium]